MQTIGNRANLPPISPLFVTNVNQLLLVEISCWLIDWFIKIVAGGSNLQQLLANWFGSIYF